MTLPLQLLSPDLWRSLKVDSLYTLHESGELRPSTLAHASAVYGPASDIPFWVFCRTSESTKRLEKGLEMQKESEVESVSVYTVHGAGSPIGVLVAVAPDLFKSAHCTPDGVHLCTKQGEVADDAIVKSIFAYKTFRSFRVGAPLQETAHDVLITAKTRWFRRRNNPKFLGFSKDKA